MTPMHAMTFNPVVIIVLGSLLQKKHADNCCISVLERLDFTHFGCGGCQVLIFDFDVHCGNGTIDIFCEDPSVLVVDMHERDVWPHTGHIDQVGHSKGQGFTVDIPMPGMACRGAACPVQKTARIQQPRWPACSCCSILQPRAPIKALYMHARLGILFDGQLMPGAQALLQQATHAAHTGWLHMWSVQQLPGPCLSCTADAMGLVWVQCSLATRQRVRCSTGWCSLQRSASGRTSSWSARGMTRTGGTPWPSSTSRAQHTTSWPASSRPWQTSCAVPSPRLSMACLHCGCDLHGKLMVLCLEEHHVHG